MLEGTLESFTLPDIFQLLSLTKKTGCLVLQHDGDTGRVYFDAGQVYYALSSSGRLALGRRLVGAGLVSTEQLRAALDQQAQLREDGRGLRLGQILLEGEALSADTLETFVREQIQDAVFDLMRWQDGSFSFDTSSHDAKVTEPIELSVSVENLIMEGSRRLEEWEQVRRKIPSMSAVVAMAPMPGDGGVEVSLKPEEWRLLTVVDGRRTVQDLVDLFGQGEFQTCKVLYGMVGAGLLEVRDPDLEGPPSIAALLQQQGLLDALEDGGTREGATADAGDAVARSDDDTPAAVDDVLDDHDRRDRDDGHQDDRDDEASSDAGDQAEDESVAEIDLPDDPDGDDTDGAGGTDGGSGEKRLTTDPSIDADLVRRLIAGVEGL